MGEEVEVYASVGLWEDRVHQVAEVWGYLEVQREVQAEALQSFELELGHYSDPNELVRPRLKCFSLSDSTS